MINKKRYGFSTFAANCTRGIQQSNQSVEWYWVKSSFNIAYWLKRGKSYADLNEGNIWQQGPHFLTNSVSKWPIISQTKVVNIPEQSKNVFIAATDDTATETLADRIHINRFTNINLP